MKQILLVCNAGMSSGILARKMEDAANGTMTIKAVGVSEYKDHVENKDLLIVGPQIRFQLDEISKAVPIPVMLIDFQKYGLMDAEGILNDVRSALEMN
ncbi:PTS sugar transporter subunit IIB [Lysinibacillus piscis]|uniref:PTS sugar transporter subunit IIB n=1 Tax=Lysinibacillus piscis TaxID=2518931 RepID=A0ABQ5NLD3_9BACI|nr:PTS sugar transporter subunit IIB [Lysinibacillus sp. KH24]GLC89075.1 PTS sugar transporter subunit IIB [Lysinibacillus sp. KH24]